MTNVTMKIRRGQARSALPVYVLIIIITLLMFLPWSKGYFLYDDWMLYARNSGHPMTEQLNHISDASCSSHYRPLSELSLGLIWALFGFNPFGHHLVNIAIHALNSVLVSFLTWKLTRDRRMSLLSGLMFAVLACHAEVVIWMSARHEMIATTFVLLGFVSYIKFREQEAPIWCAIATLLYITSLGFKETSLAYPLFLLAYDLLFSPSRMREKRLNLRHLIPALPSLAVGIAYTAYRLKVGGGYHVPVSLLGPPKNLVYYLLMESIALPDSTQFLSRFPFVTVPILITLAVTCFVLLWLARNQIWRDRASWFGALWMVFALGPVILIVTERTTYLSSVGWALLVAAVVTLVWKQNSSRLRRNSVLALMIIILTANMIALTHRGYYWNRAASLSRRVFTQVKHALLLTPPANPARIWFVNMPKRIDYAYAFGDRVLFAVWLLEEQTGSHKAQVTYIQESQMSPDDVMQQARIAHDDPVLVFYWLDGRIIELP